MGLLFDSSNEKKEKRQQGEGLIPTEDLEVGCVEGHFLDSGAFTQWTLAEKWAKKTGNKTEDYFALDEFRAYMDDYAKFIKEHEVAIDLYANVDAIGYPEITWRNQRYLEKQHDLKPVPVVHYPTDISWLRHYVERGYEIIGLGGLVGSTSQDGCRGWIDRCFDYVCSTPTRMPQVKIHGFGVTTYELLLRWPWWSVDSTSWTKIGAYGGILIPHKRKGKWDFSEHPYLMKVSVDSPSRSLKNQHLLNLVPADFKIVAEWLDDIGIPMGKMDKFSDTVLEYGVSTRHTERRAANLHFFERLREWLDNSGKKYPWPFTSTRPKTFGLV